MVVIRLSPTRTVMMVFLLALLANGQERVSFSTSDGGLIVANLYGAGDRGVVLAHGGQFNKESWDPPARVLKKAGFRVLVLAAVRYLHRQGAKVVSVVGGSMGGSAAAEASIKSEAGEIEGVVLLGAAPYGPAEQIKSRTLFIVARDDTNGAGPRLPLIRAQYEKAPPPKQMVVLEGSAHAQFVFQTKQRDRVMREILQFLSRAR